MNVWLSSPVVIPLSAHIFSSSCRLPKLWFLQCFKVMQRDFSMFHSHFNVKQRLFKLEIWRLTMESYLSHKPWPACSFHLLLARLSGNQNWSHLVLFTVPFVKVQGQSGSRTGRVGRSSLVMVGRLFHQLKDVAIP